MLATLAFGCTDSTKQAEPFVEALKRGDYSTHCGVASTAELGVTSRAHPGAYSGMGSENAPDRHFTGALAGRSLDLGDRRETATLQVDTRAILAA